MTWPAPSVCVVALICPLKPPVKVYTILFPASATVTLTCVPSTFVPAPLPPDLSYDAALVLALSRADAALSELAGLELSCPTRAST